MEYDGSEVAEDRAHTDASLGAERVSADAGSTSEGSTPRLATTVRTEHEAHRSRLEARRSETDAQLSTERSSSDRVVIALADTTNLLARSRSAQVRGGDVLAMVTHDLRNPLSVIAMNAQTIAEETQEDFTREAAEEMTRAAAQMERLLTDLLDVARIDSASLRIVKEPFDVGALLMEVLHSYRPLFAGRGVTFEVRAMDSACVVELDHDRIVQVLSNVLGNAMKFTPSGGTVDLHVESRADEVEFVLKDTGPGIEPSALPHMFERFSQMDSDTRRGLGLGLHICQKIVEAHGGTIALHSVLGEGTTVRFTLPAVGVVP